jgi:Cu(I)/Ag(I) efflux system membrane fusion protein/cobalt-zinc-cadmium efflux system membrane fusion protein
MYARVAMASPLGDRIVVPASAVLSSGIRNVAFIDRGDGYFRPVDVELGPRAGDDVVIQSGLAAGDRVVASASFLIDSESQLQAASGSYVPPPPGVAASSNEAQGAFSEKSPKIEFTSDPNPPARGTNRISITLRDAASGKPISGASVSVNFFMPGMPAMNMSAMRASPEVREDSAGVYRGIVDLHSGGTWQVTVSASVNGHLISTKRFEVSVTGPMSM